MTRLGRGRTLFAVALAALYPAIVAGQAQEAPAEEVAVQGPTLDVKRDRGFAAAWIGALDAWGWDVATLGDSATAVGPAGSRLTVYEGSPYVRYDGALLQLADAAYRVGPALFVPVQLFEELSLPMSPPPARVSRSRGLSASGASGAGSRTQPAGGVAGPASVRVVVIDAGHGGRDLGALGYGGTREKDVALDVALALERILREWPDYRVYMIRDEDEFVPLWERGGLGTAMKGDRPGVFLSIHANSHPTSREAQGFETYFLADARTEHERRITALENAEMPAVSPAAAGGGDLGSLLEELRNLDYQHWSAHLATLVQEELGGVHPGRNRGVSQAPLAAITTSLMPSALVEMGYITNADEEALLRDTAFHEALAGALARAVDRFFEGYPPRTATERAGNRP